jgi:pimeloyl-ACP methyl ester carboxylesterase
VLAPDLIGFGKSDKPAERGDYSYASQVAWIRHWIEALALTDITLVCQDWGSLIGLRLAAENPQRFLRILIGNGGLPTGDGRISKAFLVWRAFATYSPWFSIGRIVQGGTKRRLTAAERAAYDAPFPSSAYKAGARVYPSLVPVTPDNPASEANRRAWKVFERWDKPFICCYSDGDPITRNGPCVPRAVPGARPAARRCVARISCRRTMRRPLRLVVTAAQHRRSAANRLVPDSGIRHAKRSSASWRCLLVYNARVRNYLIKKRIAYVEQVPTLWTTTSPSHDASVMPPCRC